MLRRVSKKPLRASLSSTLTPLQLRAISTTRPLRFHYFNDKDEFAVHEPEVFQSGIVHRYTRYYFPFFMFLYAHFILMYLVYMHSGGRKQALEKQKFLNDMLFF